MPIAYSCSYVFPSLLTVTCSLVLNAFTQLTPTPCKPPDTLYDPLSNFPPACNTVMTTSNALLFSLVCIPVGIPLPSSCTVIELSSFIATVMFLQCPANASSIELSTTSYTRWCNPFTLMSPIYIAGLFLTASSPSNT